QLDVPMSAQTPLPGSRPAIPTLTDYKGEEAISTALKKLLVEGTPKVYFLTESGASLTAGIGASYSELLGALDDEGFAIAGLDLVARGRIPDDAAVVALLEPHRELPAQATEALWTYLRRGGRVFFNVGYTLVPEEWNPRFRELGERLGFELGEELVCHGIQD